LLNEPINDMLMEIEEKKSAALAASLEEQANRENTMPTEEEMRSAEEEETMSVEDFAEMQRKKKKIIELKAKIASASWLTKYAPRKFTDLISDERSNRELLRWLKMWDKIVFNKKTPDQMMNHSIINPSVMKASNGQNRNNNYNNNSSKYQQKTEELYDASGRPMKKIALVSGGPGSGKTTLAHIAAKHAGYRVVEINAASTQKSTNGLVEAVKQAVEMRSVLESMKGISVSTRSDSQNARPNCLVIWRKRRQRCHECSSETCKRNFRRQEELEWSSESSDYPHLQRHVFGSIATVERRIEARQAASAIGGESHR
jgi:hypothetical protein